MKNLSVIIALFCNFMTLSAIENAQNKAQDMQQSPYLNFDTAIAYLSEKWQLSNLQVFVYPSIFNNYIARAYSDTYQQEVVLKISESNDECKALQYLQSEGMVKLLSYDHENCALLLQYIPSQVSLIDYLSTENDDWIINAFVSLFKKIHTFPKNVIIDDFKTSQDHFTLLRSYNFIKIPQNLLEKALQISDQLDTLNEPQYLLHCDLHCRNILKFEDSFIAIDPLAVIGPLEYEAASFVSSPTDFLLSQNNIEEILQNRLNKLSELLNLNKKILKKYAFMRVLFLACLCETKDKNDDWIDQFIQVAEIIDQLDDNQ